MTGTDQTKILVVEDDTYLLKSVSRYINQNGYETLEAVNGYEALELIKKEHPALILSDLRMPVMDGFDLLDEVAHEAPQTPVIIFSGVGGKPDIIQAFRAGAWDYIIKPIDDIDILIEKIEQTLIQAQMTYGYNDTMEKAVKNITKDYEIEQQRCKELETRIAYAKQELERMIDCLSEPVALLDKKHCLLRSNKAMAELYNKEPAELVGVTKYLSTAGFNNEQQAIIDFKSVESGQFLSGSFFDEAKRVEYEVNVTPYYDINHTMVVGYVYIARVISER